MAQADFREFMTTWHRWPRPEFATWSNRVKSDLVGTMRSTRAVPMFRPFDLLDTPNQRLVLLENDDHRIGVESVCGTQPEFRRHINFDTVYFQFAGTSLLETEYGEYTMPPGDIIMIPEGISHRSTGSADSLRWFAFANEPFTDCMTSENQTSETEFAVTRRGGPNWQVPARSANGVRGGRVAERMICWDDGPEDATVGDRDYEALVGASSTHFKEKISAIRHLRAFDVFKEIVGKSGGANPIFRSPFLEIKTYNIIGEQFAFHRALRTEEVRIQFRGTATDMSELGNTDVAPGQVTVIPFGIAHSVITDPVDSTDFLRLNFYSTKRWRYPNDLTRHAFTSSFEVATNVKKVADWKVAASR